MNKILIGNKIEVESGNVLIKDNVITFLDSDLYEIEYTSTGKYDLVFKIDNDVNILEYSFDKELHIHNRYVVNNGKLCVTNFFDNKYVDSVVDIDLVGVGSEIQYYFSNICHQEEKYLVNVNHLTKCTNSLVINKSVALKNSKIDFIINSNVLKEAIKSNLNQTTRIVTMGKCDTKICPNMFTPLDDVSAKHGSIVGTFKEEDIFYLMSKGISYNDSLKLLIKGFLLSNMIENHEIRKKIIDIIDLYWR